MALHAPACYLRCPPVGAAPGKNLTELSLEAFFKGFSKKGEGLGFSLGSEGFLRV